MLVAVDTAPARFLRIVPVKHLEAFDVDDAVQDVESIPRKQAGIGLASSIWVDFRFGRKRLARFRLTSTAAASGFACLESQRTIQILSRLGLRSSLAWNRAGCVATNSVHTVELTGTASPRTIREAWNGPLTSLSCEIEGHPLGGGMLKLEPRPASLEIAS